MAELSVVLLPVGSYRLLLPSSCLLRVLDQPLIEQRTGRDYVRYRGALWPLLTPRFTGAGEMEHSNLQRSTQAHSIRVVLVNHQSCRFAIRVMDVPETTYLQQGQLRLRRDLVPGAYASGAYEWGKETVLLPSLRNIQQALKS